ncbi:MAG: MtrB/PioB family outer membrane beta-barrel protein, partial [Betaproteobacteria bacterium]
NVRSFLADRKRDQVRLALDATPVAAVSFGGSVDYNRDDYQHSVYGLKSGNSWALNLDANYQPTNKLNLYAFYTYESMRSSQNGNGGQSVNESVAGYTGPQYLDPLRQWGITIRDKANTFGLGLKQKGLLGGKLQIGGDLVYTRASTAFQFSGGNVYPISSIPPLVPIPAESLPDATNRYVSLLLDGRYALDKKSSMRVTYLYRRLVSSDSQFDALVGVTIPSFVRTNEVSPNYTMNVIGVSYIRYFR